MHHRVLDVVTRSLQAGFSSVPTPSCHLRTHNARACGRRDIDKHHSPIATPRTRRRTTSCPFYEREAQYL